MAICGVVMDSHRATMSLLMAVLPHHSQDHLAWQWGQKLDNFTN